MSFDEEYSHILWVDLGVVGEKDSTGQLGISARHLDSGRSTADHGDGRRREIHVLTAGDGVGGAVELGEDVLSKHVGVGGAFESEPMLGNTIDAKVCRHASEGQYQRVVGEAGGVVENDSLSVEIDIDHATLERSHRGDSSGNSTGWVAHVSSVEASGRNLVQQRLKRVVVPCIDERDCEINADLGK